MIELTGASSSNAGHEFHELWATRECLRLLDHESSLDAIKIEGTNSSNKKFKWHGVDCALYFGGTTNSDADRVEIKQLKYSRAKTVRKWTIAEISRGKNGKPSKSLIAKLATAYLQLKAERPEKDFSSIGVSLITNQPVCDGLLAAIESARQGLHAKRRNSQSQDYNNLRRIFEASGLSADEFQEFAKVLDLSGEAGSRFAFECKIFDEVAQWTEIESAEVTRRLREMVRRQMISDSSNDYIDRGRVLAQFGVSDLRALLPCPSKIKSSDSCVKRSSTKNITKQLLAGKQKICLHGAAGIGKTTTLAQLEKCLPEESEMVIFDCYGGGSYLDASSLRHRPQDAFVQMCNEIAIRLRMPLLLSARADTDYAKVFRHRLEKFAKLISLRSSEALLLIAIDAADNSENAARERGSVERNFIYDFMSYEVLPNNVRFIVSARSGRLEQLKIPDDYVKIELEKFVLEETAANARGYWDAPQGWINELHELSDGVPRMQGYALERPTLPIEKRIDLLKPSGKDLNQIFDGIFQDARKKAGIKIELQKFCACIAVLPRPIPICEIAEVLEIDQEAAKDFCIDLDPGVKSKGDFVTFADEDIEAYVRKFADPLIDDMLTSVADRFLTRHKTDEYAAINVAPMLKLAKKHKRLLKLVQKHPEPDAHAVAELVIRQEVRTQRLKLAIGVCRDAGKSERTLRFVLLGAEAMKNEAILQSLLTENPQLTAKHAPESGSRLILSDPQQTENQGPLLIHMMAECAANEDFIGVRDFRRRFESWLSRRIYDLETDENETDTSIDPVLSAADMACLLYTELLESGAKATIARLRRIRPLRSLVLSAKLLIERLGQERRFELMEQLAESLSVSKSIFVLVSLALAGRKIDHARLSLGLKILLRRLNIRSPVLSRTFENNALVSYIFDTLLTGVEILSASDKENKVVNQVLELFLDPKIRRIDQVKEHDDSLIDAIVRCFTLSNCLEDKQTDLSKILIDRPESQKGGRNQHNYEVKQRDRRLREQVSVIGQVYVARARILAGKVPSNQVTELLHESCRELKSGWWQNYLDHDFAMLRSRAAYSLTVLLKEQRLKNDVMTAIWTVSGNQWLLNLTRIAPRILLHKELYRSFYLKVREAAQIWQKDRTGAYEKSQCLMSLAELLIPISSDESKIIFNKSIDVAGDISSEIADVIRLFDILVRFGLTSMSENRSKFATALTLIVENAYRRVKYAHHFPWREALSSIARLDANIALASIAKWHDQGIVSLENNLARIVHIATSTNQISCSAGHALMIIAETTKPEDVEKMIDITEEQDSCVGIAEEVRLDLLSNRIDCTDRIKDFVSKYCTGISNARLTQYFEFKKSLPAAKNDNDVGQQLHKKQFASLDSHHWDREDLLSGRRLKVRADAIIRICRENKENVSLEMVLESATNKVAFGDSINHLEALMEVQENCPDESIMNVITDTVAKWKAQDAVLEWYRNELPRIISLYFATDFNFLHGVDKRLSEILNLSKASNEQAVEILLDVIQRNGEKLSSRVTLAIAGIIASKQEPASAAKLFEWYVDRLLTSIRKDDREMEVRDAIPTSANETVARFIYAFLGDIDLRVRWRAAHAVRRLARLGESDLIDCIWRQWGRMSEPVFRSPEEPFYWISARLWLVIALSRISEESPKEIASLGQELFEIAVSDDFPHVLIKAYARDAALELHSSGFLSLGKDEISNLEKVNQSPLARADNVDLEEEDVRVTIDLLLNGGQKQKEQTRFDFDGLDTLRYWYEPWTRIFEGLSNNDFQRIAERWIIDKWGYIGKESNGSRHFRSVRFKKYHSERTTNSHGHLPTVEHYRTYLEWHAMWCTVGELLSSHKLSKPRYEGDEGLADQISCGMLSFPPVWLSDMVGLRPLNLKHWCSPNSFSTNWFSSIDDEEFIAELMPSDRPDYLVVHASTETKWRNHQEVVQIFSSLVSPQTAHSLVNALQTAQYTSDYYLGPEGSRSDITEDGFELKSWLVQPDGNLGLDSKDSLCQDIGNIAIMPGTIAQRSLELTRTYSPNLAWYRKGHKLPSFIYEAWGERVQSDSNLRIVEGVVSSGHRLLARRRDIAKLLEIEKFDLITEVGVTRNERQQQRHLSGSKSENEVTFVRILLLRGSGEIEGAERNFGTWRKNFSKNED